MAIQAVMKHLLWYILDRCSLALLKTSNWIMRLLDTPWFNFFREKIPCKTYRILQAQTLKSLWKLWKHWLESTQHPLGHPYHLWLCIRYDPARSKMSVAILLILMSCSSLPSLHLKQISVLLFVVGWFNCLWDYNTGNIIHHISRLPQAFMKQTNIQAMMARQHHHRSLRQTWSETKEWLKLRLSVIKNARLKSQFSSDLKDISV